MTKEQDRYLRDDFIEGDCATELHSAKPTYISKYRGRIQEGLRGYPRHAQDVLDLHRCKYQEAMSMLASFIRESIRARLKTIRIITGRGAHSKNGKATLRDATGYRLAKLEQNRIVRAYRLEEFSKHGSYMVYL